LVCSKNADESACVKPTDCLDGRAVLGGRDPAGPIAFVTGSSVPNAGTTTFTSFALFAVQPAAQASLAAVWSDGGASSAAPTAFNPDDMIEVAGQPAQIEVDTEFPMPARAIAYQLIVDGKRSNTLCTLEGL
jgi:hypothetical protein